jgi:hypothetical protein
MISMKFTPEKKAKCFSNYAAAVAAPAPSHSAKGSCAVPPQVSPKSSSRRNSFDVKAVGSNARSGSYTDNMASRRGKQQACIL